MEGGSLAVSGAASVCLCVCVCVCFLSMCVCVCACLRACVSVCGGYDICCTSSLWRITTASLTGGWGSSQGPGVLTRPASYGAGLLCSHSLEEGVFVCVCVCVYVQACVCVCVTCLWTYTRNEICCWPMLWLVILFFSSSRWHKLWADSLL